MMLHDNGHDYHILTNATKNIKGVAGLTCEVGLREGGGTKYIIDALLEGGDLNRTHIAIDPYGSIPYVQSEEKVRGDGDEPVGPYPNKMMKHTLSELYGYIFEKDIEVLFFPLEDTEYFARYGSGVPVYHNAKKEIINTYALVYLDGPHNLESTLREAQFFAQRSVHGSIIVFDDIVNYYDHGPVKSWMIDNGWKLFEEAGTKNSYVKD